MHKHTITNLAYVIVVIMLACLSLGSTYAYFSASDPTKVSAPAGSNLLGKIDIEWRDGTLDASIPTLFNSPNEIAINTDLKRGDYTDIKANDKNDTERTIKLAISNTSGTVAAYCRIQITAQYKPKNATKFEDCGTQWVQLALDNGTTTKLITDNGWFYENGYYYLGTKSSVTGAVTLQKLDARTSKTLANKIYLLPTSSTQMYGASVKITLKVDGVQATHDAYKTAWSVTW